MLHPFFPVSDRSRPGDFKGRRISICQSLKISSCCHPFTDDCAVLKQCTSQISAGGLFVNGNKNVYYIKICRRWQKRGPTIYIYTLLGMILFLSYFSITCQENL